MGFLSSLVVNKPFRILIVAGRFKTPVRESSLKPPRTRGRKERPAPQTLGREEGSRCQLVPFGGRRVHGQGQTSVGPHM